MAKSQILGNITIIYASVLLLSTHWASFSETAILLKGLGGEVKVFYVNSKHTLSFWHLSLNKYALKNIILNASALIATVQNTYWFTTLAFEKIKENF